MLAIYVLLVAITAAGEPVLAPLPPPLRLAIVLPVLTALMTWVVMPRLSRMLRGCCTTERGSVVLRILVGFHPSAREQHGGRFEDLIGAARLEDLPAQLADLLALGAARRYEVICP